MKKNKPQFENKKDYYDYWMVQIPELPEEKENKLQPNQYVQGGDVWTIVDNWFV